MNKLRIAALAATTFAFTLSAFAAADKDVFTLVHGGKPVGKASYTISKSKDGFHVVAHFQYHVGIGRGGDLDESANGVMSISNKGGGGSQIVFNEGQMTEDYKITDDENYLSGFIQNATNQMLTSYQPDKARKVVIIGQNQGGIAGDSRSLELPSPDFLIAADYDPSAIQLLVNKVMNHPHKDNTYLVLTPVSYGGRPGGTQAVPVAMALMDGAASGTLDGKPVTLKHFQMKFHSGAADIYTDDAGNLMEADMGTLSTNYVRNGFALAK